jgi:parallel beta-helix repeat protein
MKSILLLGIFVTTTAQVSSTDRNESEDPPVGRIYYVRQTVGNDANDGLSPASAWESISGLGEELEAGDTVYIGPGLYRENIALRNSGTAENRIQIIGDGTGRHTGDPPGPVMIAGSDPVDEDVFRPHSIPGVYEASSGGSHVLGVVEMDGPQYRYTKATDTKEHRSDGQPPLDVVVNQKGSFFYDPETERVFIHTSDGRHPSEHEIELIRRGNGISLYGIHYVTVVGFTLRNMGDAGITFFTGSSNAIAINNTSYGSRQGIRVYNATNTLVFGNTLFRNDNSGVYFAKQSTNGYAIGNILYENIKGLRWSSESKNGLAIGNIIFDNHQAGISLEGGADDIRLVENSVLNNGTSQLLVSKTRYSAESNCYENGNPEQLIGLFLYAYRYQSLAEYQDMKNRDLSSREGGCGTLPRKVDVAELHAESMGYTERARKELAALAAAPKLSDSEQ